MCSGMDNPGQEALVKTHFDAHSDDWEAIYSRGDIASVIIRRRRDYVLKFIDGLSFDPGAKVLDLGCGTGFTSVELLRRGFDVVGVDVSEQMLERARHRCEHLGFGSRVTFQAGNAEGLELPDDTFDAAIALGLIEYLRWDRWALQEVRRVLKPGGYLIVTAPNRARLSHRLMRLTAKVEDRARYYWRRACGLLRKRRGGEDATSTEQESNGAAQFARRLYYPSDLRNLLDRLDFDIVDSMTHGFGPLPLVRRSNLISSSVDWVLDGFARRGCPPALAEYGNDCIVVCGKPQGTASSVEPGIFKDLPARLDRFERQWGDLFTQREEWLQRFPRYAHPNVKVWGAKEEAPQRVLVLSPHPDDDIIGCGGTLARWMAAGSIVTVLYVTDGSATSALAHTPDHVRRTVRVEEAKAVADSMGFAEVVLWKEVEEGYRCTASGVKKLTTLLESVNPDIVFVPFVNDPIPAHVVVNELLARSLQASTLNLDDVRIANYEVCPCLLPANRVSPIDGQWDMKCRMLMKYRTAMKPVDWVYECEVRHAYHAHTLLGRRGLVEVFFEIDGQTYIRLVLPTRNDDERVLRTAEPERMGIPA